MMDTPGASQFAVVKVLSMAHLLGLIRDGQHDYFVPVAGARQPLVISLSADGALSVFEPASEHHDRFAAESLFASYVDRLARAGRLFYSAAAPH